MRRMEKQVRIPNDQQTKIYEEHKRIISLSTEKQYDELEKITRAHLVAPVVSILDEMKKK